jgi:hypothetical protein
VMNGRIQVGVARSREILTTLYANPVECYRGVEMRSVSSMG